MPLRSSDSRINSNWTRALHLCRSSSEGILESPVSSARTQIVALVRASPQSFDSDAISRSVSVESAVKKTTKRRSNATCIAAVNAVETSSVHLTSESEGPVGGSLIDYELRSQAVPICRTISKPFKSFQLGGPGP